MTLQKKKTITINLDEDNVGWIDNLILNSERVYRSRSQVINVALYQFFKARGEIGGAVNGEEETSKA
jgi:Arc/MetJ-type ribon-helix-helix transcriptional regulator